jgi:hypothetical protein
MLMCNTPSGTTGVLRLANILDEVWRASSVRYWIHEHALRYRSCLTRPIADTHTRGYHSLIGIQGLASSAWIQMARPQRSTSS